MWKLSMSSQLNIIIANFIIRFFAKLSQKNIIPLVLRNYEGLPYSLNGNDIDLLIRRKDYKLAKSILYETGRKMGVNLIIYRFWKNVHTFTLVWDYNVSLKIDFLINFENRGRVFLRSKEVLQFARSRDTFFVPDPIHEAIINFLKPLLSGGSMKLKYFPKIKTVFLSNERKVRSIMKRFFSNKTLDELFELIEKEEIDKIEKLSSRMNREAFFNFFIQNPLEFVLNVLHHYVIEMVRMISLPQNSFFAILGPDGIGKTTVAEQAIKRLRSTLKLSKHYTELYHFRPCLFPNLRKLILRDENPSDFQRPYRAKPAGFVSSLLRMSYYWLDYLIGYYLKIRPGLRRYKIILFDRYFHEFLVDPKRSRIKLPMWIRKVFYIFVPKPRLVFILNAPPQVILKRKQELNLRQLKNLIKSYESVGYSLKNVIFIDASKPADVVSNEIAWKIIESISERFL